MTKNLLLATTLLFSFILTAQDAVFEWARSIGSSNLEQIQDMSVDNFGNTYLTSGYSYSMDFDPGVGIEEHSPIGSTDIFITKLNNLGDFEWALSFGDVGSDFGVSIFTDDIGFVYITGRYSGTIDFDPSPDIFELTSISPADCFVLKLNTDGELIWVKSFGGDFFDLGNAITVDDTGNIYTAGVYHGTADFNPGLGIFEMTSVGEGDVFIQKLNSDGDFIWAKSIGGSAEQEIKSINLDEFDNVYLGGRFEGVCDFNPSLEVFTLSSYGLFDGYIVKLNSEGSFLWATQLGGSSQDRLFDLTIDEENNVYSTGFFANTVDFDPGVSIMEFTSSGYSDQYIQKLDSEGNLIWAKSVGTSGSDQGNSILVDPIGNVYVTGFFSSTVDFDPGAGNFSVTSNGATDCFLQKLDSEGDFVWVKTFGADDQDQGNVVRINSEGDIYLAGEYQKIVDFNPGPGEFNIESNGRVDIFILKLNSCTIDETTDEITSCISHTWINGVTYFEDNNTATYVLTNMEGCDSIITLDLTINEVDVSTNISDGVITSNATGATYQWLDCNDDYAEIVGETGVNYTPIEDGDYAVQVTIGACIDTSNCVSIEGLSIVDENQLSDIKIFPNPSNGFINMDLSGLTDISINVFTINGQLIYSANTLNEELYSFQLDVQSGIYIVELTSSQQIKQFKLVVE